MTKKPTARRNIKKSFLKKPDKPVSPAIAIAAIAGVFAVFIIVLGLKVWMSLPHPIQTPARNEYLSLIPTQLPSQPTPNSTDERFIPLTPTLLPASRQGWMTFVYPDQNKKYTFGYPSTSNLSVDKDRYSDWITVGLGNIGGYSSCRINFTGEANDEPWPGTVTNKESMYGGRKARVETISKDNIPYTEFISFEDSAEVAKDPFSFMQAFFPPANNVECQQLVDQILTSLKFYY